MKSEDSMTIKIRRRDTEELKVEAVRVVCDSARPVAQVARDLGIADHLLYRWRAEQQQAESRGHFRQAMRTEHEERARLRQEHANVETGAGFFKMCGGVLRAGTAMRYQMIQEYDRRYPIRLMCRALAVSPAGYYAWRTRPVSARSVANQTLLTELCLLHHESRQPYGSPRMWRVLVERGGQVRRHRVAQLMRHDGLRAKTVTKWRTTPTPPIRCRWPPIS
jgi:transposase-like protein